MNALTRRQMLQRSSLAIFGATLPAVAIAQRAPRRPAAAAPDGDGDDLPVSPAAPDPKDLVRQNRSSRSVQEYYVRRVREVMRAADARRAALRTKADAERYVADVRIRLRQCYGPIPDKTSLNARITAVHERKGYRIENVIYESRPGFPVTANLFLPTGRPGPSPGVLAPVGHANSGKGSAQSVAQALVRQGYVVLAFDPMGQGERLQYVDEQLKPKFGVGTSEHTYCGVRMVGSPGTELEFAL